MLVLSLLIILFAETVTTHWRTWSAAGAALAVVTAIWLTIRRIRIRHLDMKYGFSITYVRRFTYRIDAFNGGVKVFSVDLDTDGRPAGVYFTQAVRQIPDLDVPNWKERLSEYLKRRIGEFELV